MGPPHEGSIRRPIALSEQIFGIYLDYSDVIHCVVYSEVVRSNIIIIPVWVWAFKCVMVPVLYNYIGFMFVCILKFAF